MPFARLCYEMESESRGLSLVEEAAMRFAYAARFENVGPDEVVVSFRDFLSA